MTASAPFILIDAYSQIFRSFYAIRHLNAPDGSPVNAIYVFTRLLLSLEKEYSPQRGALIFDCGKVAFRLALLPEYKANRPPMPEELSQQIPAIREMAAAFGWNRVQAEGYEADDLIAGFAKSAAPAPVHILSSDKDLSQLVDGRVQMLSPANGNTGGLTLRGEREVEEKFGIPAGMIADYLALTGDSSDNISGVPGIGGKSAVKILLELGAVESWMDDQERISSSKFAAKLTGQSELLRRNLGLVRLKDDLPDDFPDMEAVLHKDQPNWRAIAALCRKFGFKSILKELPPEALEDAVASVTPEVEVNAQKTAAASSAADDFGDLFSSLSDDGDTGKDNEHPDNSGEEKDDPFVQGELF